MSPWQPSESWQQVCEQPNIVIVSKNQDFDIFVSRYQLLSFPSYQNRLLFY